MKLFVLSVLSFPLISFAQVKNVHIEDFNLSYQNPSGKGYATHFDYNLGMIESEQLNILVNKEGNNFRAILSGAENREILVQNAPSIVTESQALDITKLNLKLDEVSSFSMEKGTFQSPKNNLDLSNISLNCGRDKGLPEVIDQIISGCVSNMVFTMSDLQADATESSVGVKKVRFNVSNGALDFTADIRADVSGKAKGKGSFTYDATKGIIGLQITEVKFGIFNVTGKVFDAISKNQNDKLKVKRPWIYYQIR